MDVIDKERITFLNKKECCRGTYVLYWMNHSFRVKYNHALIFAIHMANQLKLPLLVYTGISEPTDERGLKHYKFMLEGLREVEDDLKKIFIKHVVWIINPVTGVVNLSASAAAVITDTGYMKECTEQSDEVAHAIECCFISVESNSIVPVKSASEKDEYSAATFRPRIKRKLDFFLKAPPEIKPELSSIDIRLKSIDLSEPENIYDELKLARDNNPEKILSGGHSHASRKLGSFISRKLDLYSEKRNEPSVDLTSHMSPYLRYGQISPIEIALKIMKTESPGRDSYLEELIVRRELSINFVHYNENYDNLRCLPDWAYETLISHEAYPRDFIYTRSDFEKCRTHDINWNAAQHELVTTGKMHGYMRMYWAKKMLEWSKTPEEALRRAIQMNDRYELDGRDPNGYVGCAWAIGGVHDRAWFQHPVFGKIRYMNYNGCRKKFNVDMYIDTVQRL